MGMTDHEIVRRYSSTVSNILNDLPINSSVAWLGQKHPNMMQDRIVYDSIMSGVNNELFHNYYDLNNKEFEGSVKWDVHSRWDIKNYDLVLGLRVLYLCESRKKLMKNLQEVVKHNKRVVFDFMTGNPQMINNKEVFLKPNNGKAILPHFPEFYNCECDVSENHDDQKIILSDFEKLNLSTHNILTFRDMVKNRFYTLMEIGGAT